MVRSLEPRNLRPDSNQRLDGIAYDFPGADGQVAQGKGVGWDVVIKNSLAPGFTADYPWGGAHLRGHIPPVPLRPAGSPGDTPPPPPPPPPPPDPGPPPHPALPKPGDRSPLALAVRDKLRKYEALRLANPHIDFHPLSFDTTGAWGMESVRFVKRLCHKAALELGVHPSVHFAVWRRRITLAIGRMAAVAIDRHAADVLRTRSGVSRFSGHDPPDFEDLCGGSAVDSGAPVPGATSTD